MKPEGHRTPCPRFILYFVSKPKLQMSTLLSPTELRRLLILQSLSISPMCYSHTDTHADADADADAMQMLKLMLMLGRWC